MSEERIMDLGYVDLEAMEEAAKNLGYNTAVNENVLTVTGNLYVPMKFTADITGKVSASYDNMNTNKYAELIAEYGEVIVTKEKNCAFISMGKTRTKDEVILKLKRRR